MALGFRVLGPAVVLASLLFVHPATLHAQSVRGSVVEEGSLEPVDGAVVSLFGSEATPVARALTGSDGQFILRIREGGDFELVVDRIGYRSTSAFVTVTHGETVRLELRVPASPVRLDGFEVYASPQCRVERDEGLGVVRIWEEIRKALEAERFAEETRRLRMGRTHWVRQLAEEGRRVERERIWSDTARGATGFVSSPPSVLMERGFVHDDGEGSVFAAPDVQVLLSDEFWSAHCFGLTRGAEGQEDLLGLTFEPAPSRRVPGVAGTLWLDLETSHLRHLEFRYVNVDADLFPQRAGGRVEFERLPDGSWIVAEWWIRVPRRAVRHDRFSAAGGRVEFVGLQEEGGRVDWARTARGELVFERQSAVLLGTVRGAGSGQPVPGAVVRPGASDQAVTTDEQGRFRLSGLGPGRHGFSILHPALPAWLGAVATVDLEIPRRGTVRAVMEMPSAEEILRRVCVVDGDTDVVSEGFGVLAGRVLESHGGHPLPGARMTVTWRDFWIGTLIYPGRPRLSLATPMSPEAAPVPGRAEGQTWILREGEAGFQLATEEDGTFQVCGLPWDLSLLVEVSLPGGEAVTTTTRIDERGGYRILELYSTGEPAGPTRPGQQAPSHLPRPGPHGAPR